MVVGANSLRRVRQPLWGLAWSIAVFAFGACLALTHNRAVHIVRGPAITHQELGRAAFETYCSSCHGADARGDGPRGSQLRAPVADLTQIAARRGAFDRSVVASYIDGRVYVERHGTRDMPVWGRSMDDRLEGSLEQEMRLTAQTIDDIVVYLESRQQPAH